MESGVWIILTAGAGEIGRFFIENRSENNLTWDILQGIEDQGWQLDSGDTITIEEGQG